MERGELCLGRGHDVDVLWTHAPGRRVEGRGLRTAGMSHWREGKKGVEWQNSDDISITTLPDTVRSTAQRKRAALP